MSAISQSDLREIKFRGRPGNLVGVLPSAPSTIMLAMDLALPQGRMTFPVLADPGFPISPQTAHLRLPEKTPPGTYRGSLSADEAPYALAEVEVLSLTRLRLFPSRVEVEASPGAEVTVDLLALNEGNTLFEIGRAYAIGLFQIGGLEAALGRTWRTEMKPTERRVDFLLDAMAERHAGLARVGVRGGGSIRPGDRRELHLTIRLPTAMKPGYGYSGTLRIAGRPFRLAVNTTARSITREAQHD